MHSIASFVPDSLRKRLCTHCPHDSAGEAMAASKGAAGFTKATQEVSSYQTPVSNLMKAIAAVIVFSRSF